ncbi:MAG: RHS repeat domain-containing protein [Terriglobales bacterium]
MSRYQPWLLCVLLLFSGAAMAQEPSTGFPPYGSFADGAFDAINRQNLNVNFGIPIGSSPGRGLDFGFAVTHNSLLWKKNGSVWSPVADASSNPTWGWVTEPSLGAVKYQTETEFCYETNKWYTIYFDYSYTDPAGTKHSFPISTSTAPPADAICGLPPLSGSGSATDGSGYYMTAIQDTVTVYSPGGVKLTGSGPSTMTDTNGNYISKVVVSSSETHWKDTLGRIALKVVKSGSTITYQVLDPTGAYQTTNLNLQSFSIKTNFACSGVTEYNGTASLPVSIALPNGRSYSFTYEDTPGFSGYKTGRVLRVTLPTGGYYEYQYPTTGNNGINCGDATVTSLTRVINDGTSSSTWQYARAPVGANWETTVTAPQLPYDAAANQSVFTFNSSKQLITSKAYQGSAASGTLLRTANTTWTSGAPSSTATILENNQQSKVDTTFDTYGNLTQIIEYAFGSGTPGAAVRTTTLTYLLTSNYTSRNIVNRVITQLVRTGGPTGTIKARVSVTYDGTSLTCITGAAQHNDSSYGCTFTYRGNPTTVQNWTNAATPSGSITKNFYYDSLGNLRTGDLNCCQQRQWNYSATTQYAYPDSVVSGAGGGPQLTTSATYNFSTGLVATATDENAKVTTFTYDNHKRLIDVQRPDSAHITTAYDDVARTITVSVPIQVSDLLRRITYFDGLGQAFKQQVKDAGATSYSISESQFDPLGRAYKVGTPHNSTAQYWTETRFDALGRPTVVIPPDGTPTSNKTSYSYAGTTVTITDAAGKQRKQQSDALGRLEIAFEPDVATGQLTQQTSYAYSVLDALLTVTQGAQTRTYVYDDAGRLTSAATPEAGTSSFLYNNFNQVTQRTDARGVITTYTYDTLNRLSQVSYNVGATGVPATSTVTYTYGTSSASNNNGRLLTVADGANTETYSYDMLGQITQAQKLISGTTYTVSYAYNLAGELTSMTYPSGRVVQQSYDPIGRLSSLFSGATTYANTFGYNPAGQVTGFNYGNGVTVAFGYTPERLLLSTLSYTKTSQTLFSASYGYSHPNGGKNGQITAITDNVDAGRTVNYTYDALHRLSTALTTGSGSYPQWGLSWTYDRYGNRTNQTVTAGSAPTNSLAISTTTNRITTAGYIYDANGNMTQEGSASYQYKYDAENRLVTFNTTAATYTYVGAARVKKVAGSTTTVYLFSGSKVIAEYVNAALSKEYVYSGSSLLATVAVGGATTYHHPDHLSTRVETDATGVVSRTFGQFPFGEVWYETGTASKWKFTSYERDLESGLDYAMFRYDSTRVGRFTSPDPLAGSIGNPQSLNRYVYVGNDPVNFTDSLGLVRGRPRKKVGDQEEEEGLGGSPWRIYASMGGGLQNLADPWLVGMTEAELQYLDIVAASSPQAAGGGWEDDPTDLVLEVLSDCFDAGAGVRRTTYSLHTRSGENPEGIYTIYENHTNVGLTSNGLGFSSQEGIFEDTIGPGGVIGDTSSERYWTITNGTDWYGMVPVQVDGQQYEVEGIWMHGDEDPAKTQVFVNGKLAPLCPPKE